MAKVKGPLFSLSAGGQLAKTLVYGDWKGIDWVRQYVIPANPKTDDQQEQRDFFTEAVDAWHTDGYTLEDVKAWNLYALANKIVASGFNMFVKLKLLASVAVKTWLALVNITIGVPTTTTCDVTIMTETDQTLKLYYGTSKTSMLTAVDGAWVTDTTTFAITGLTKSIVYYFYVKTTLATGAERTGIYSFKTAAE